MRIADIGQAILAATNWPVVQQPVQDDTFYPFTISEDWSILGPFQVGTREAIWGADSLERYGGFHALSEDGGQYASSLAFNGFVNWSRRSADVQDLPYQEVSADLDIVFPEIDWRLLQQVYGWSALQWQAWARGKLIITSDQDVLIWMHLKQVLEFWIDDKHYFGGDLYGFNRAPTTLKLSPGEHIIELRVIRDVRAMGGITDNPNVEVNVHISATHPALRRSTDVLLPDRLNNELGPTSSDYATVVLRNDHDVDIFINELEATHDICKAELVQDIPIKLVPGQSRPIGFRVSCIPGTSATASIKLWFKYYIDGNKDDRKFLFAWGFPRRPQPQEEPHLFTYLHPGGVVSYAIIKPPLINMCPTNSSLPILLFLHGAGIDADNDEVKHSLDDIPPVCAWTLIPSGVTSWSGDDWHDWGWADVRAAIDAVQAWIEHAEWQGPGVDVDRWLVSGHSNGGQGTWHAITHYPDNAIAAAPVSGYSSIESYVPYTWWHAADPQAQAVIRSSLLSHQNELMLENAANIPLLIQHGSADDNVPAYHSRLMHTRLQDLGIQHSLVELEGKPHYWHGVMATPALINFFDEHLNGVDSPTSGQNFTLVSANPGNTGSKDGITITELIVPGQLGRVISASYSEQHCHLNTRNVKSLAVSEKAVSRCRTLSIDGTMLVTDKSFQASKASKDGSWAVIHADEDTCQRSPEQTGGLEAMLRSKGSFKIVKHSHDVDHIALQIANNLCQYFSADVEVADNYAAALRASGNIISIAVGDNLPAESTDCDRKCAILTNGEAIAVRALDGRLHTYSSSNDNLAAAAFLRPLPDQRLELVIWATDLNNLKLAARLVPTLTGSGQPDFVIAGSSMSWQGLNGVLAAGFFDSEWCAASTSYFVEG